MNVKFVDIEEPSGQTICIKLINKNDHTKLRVNIRSTPNNTVKDNIIGKINENEIIEVYIQNFSGYFKLADGRVSTKHFIDTLLYYFKLLLFLHLFYFFMF